MAIVVLPAGVFDVSRRELDHQISKGDVFIVTRLIYMARSTRDLLNTLAAANMTLNALLDGGVTRLHFSSEPQSWRRTAHYVGN